MFMKDFSFWTLLKLKIKHLQRPRPWEWRVLYALMAPVGISLYDLLSLTLSQIRSIILRRHRNAQ